MPGLFTFKNVKALVFKTRKEWREWLEKNYNKEDKAWLVTYKKKHASKGLSYEEGVEEALCYGWIDGKMMSVDEEKFVQRYTPRRQNSPWSKLNKDRALKLIKEGRMAEPGLASVEDAKRRGAWNIAYSSKTKPRIPKDLKQALMKDEKAWSNYQKFTNSAKTNYTYWVLYAKKEETKKKRIREVVKRARLNKKPGE
jgi:uncharacterized protein YdeI (YjbR/CyaY-like superfamily)